MKYSEKLPRAVRWAFFAWRLFYVIIATVAVYLSIVYKMPRPVIVIAVAGSVLALLSAWRWWAYLRIPNS